MRADSQANERLPGAIAGVGAVLAGLAAGHLIAGLVAPEASPALAVGSRLVDLAPTPLKDWAVATLGTNDKPVLVAGVVVVALALGAGTGPLAFRHRRLAWMVPALLGLVAGAAAVTAPTATAAAVLPALVAGVAGAVTLSWLLPRRHPDDPTGTPRALPRRAFLTGTAVVGGSSAVALVTGQWFADRSRVATDVTLPVATPARTPLPAGLDVPGLSLWVTPNADFYRVDINLLVPAVDITNWRLSVDGLVDRPLSLSWAELIALPVVERDITLNCVSNEVGGPYIGGARWLGVRTRDLLEHAGVRAEADQVLSRSVDGFTISTPVQALLDDRDALVAIGMNGRPLPAEHGFPARLITPGLYGYVGATKWLTQLTLTTYAQQSAYWTVRGWAERGPVKPSSRIEVPRGFAKLPAGDVIVAGTAWAQHIGVARVQLRVDGGPWQDATLGADAGIEYWRQWRFGWKATPGEHVLESRVIDDRGVPQSEQPAAPFPDGASGLHRITVTIG
ncbi:MAG: molybdopterin-dependent oxidoreductase [Micropruina sp.]|uniref:molybdopterin-dependent oxidoreductase n=1 Tax=Micropruina sp. TaxID=2737536 RepID=UPI0039E28E8B